jgi:phosphate transport system protein
VAIAQLDGLKSRVLAYGRFVEDMIRKSRIAFAEQSWDTLASLIATDEPRANESEMNLEEECTALIAQRQPMARDLRTILMILRMTTDLERIADHGVNIAEAIRDGLAEGHLAPDPTVLAIFDATLAMLDCSLRAFGGEDPRLGQRVCESDETVDALATALLERLSASMGGESPEVPRNLALLRIAGNLERVADLSTNIGEDVIYMTEGRVIKHHREDKEPPRPSSD